MLMAALLWSAVPFIAMAQGSVGQSGPVVPGDAAVWVQNGYVMDGGPASGGKQGIGLGQFLMQSRSANTAPSQANGFGLGPFQANGNGQYNSHACDYAGSPQSSAGSYYLCWDPDTVANGVAGGVLAYGSIGVAPPLPFQICTNGICLQLPFTGSGSGNVVGVPPTTIGQIACFENTIATLIGGCSGGNVPGPWQVNTTNGSSAPQWTSFLNLPNSPSFSVSPTGNPTGGSLLQTFATISGQATTATASNREFLWNCGLTSTLGAGVANSNGDKVCIYSGVQGNSGTGNIWAGNFLTTQAAGSGSYDATGIEIDLNNFNAGRGGSDGPAGYPTVVAQALSLGGASDSNAYVNTSVVSMVSLGGASGTQPLFAHGLVCSGFYTFNCIVDYANSPTYEAIFGAHTYGIDFYQAGLSGGAIRLATNTTGGILGRNAGNTADTKLLRFDGTNAYLCETNCSGVFDGGSIVPLTTNTLNLGSPTAQWANLYVDTLQASVSAFVNGNAVATGSGSIGQCALWIATSVLSNTPCANLTPDGTTIVTVGANLVAVAGPSTQSVTANTSSTTVTPGVIAQANVALSSSTTISIANGTTDSQLLKLCLVQDATGSRTVAFDSSVLFGTTIPSFTASTAAHATDYAGFEWSAGVGKWVFLAYALGFAASGC